MNITAKELSGQHIGKTVTINDDNPLTGTLDDTGINQHGLVWVDLTRGLSSFLAVLNPNTTITIQEDK